MKYTLFTNTIFFRLILICLILILSVIPFLYSYLSYPNLSIDTKLSIVIAIFTGILSIAFPISLNLISHLEQKFKVPGISKIFFQEPLFINLILGLTAIIVISIVNSFIEFHSFPLGLSFFFLLSIFVFWSFIDYLLLIKRYMINTREVLVYKANNELNKIINSKKGNIVKYRIHFEQIFGILKYELNNNLTQNSCQTLTEIDNLFLFTYENLKNEKLEELLSDNTNPYNSNLISKNVQVVFEKSFYSNFIDEYFNCWSISNTIDNKDFSNQISNKLLIFFDKFSNQIKQPLLVRYLLFHFNDKITYYINNNLNVNISYVRFLFRWFINWQESLIENKNASKNIHAYNDSFYSFLWHNITHAIKSKKKEYYYSFIENIFRGFNVYHSSRWENPVPILPPSENREEINRIIDDLRKGERNNIKNLLIKLKKEEEKARRKLGEEWYEKSKEIFYDIRRNSIGIILINEFRDFLERCCAFALYTKNYNFISEFWHYNQPADSSTINIDWTNFLPESINEIIHKYVKSNTLNDFIKYPLEGNHDIDYYHKLYQALLIFRQYTLTERYTYQNFLSIEGIEQGVDIKEIELYRNELNDFLFYIRTVKKFKTFKKLGFKNYSLKINENPPEELIKNAIKKITNKLTLHEIESELELEKVKNFKLLLDNSYKNQTSITNILNKYNQLEKVEDGVEKYYSYKTIFPKKFFIEEGQNDLISGLENFSDTYCNIEFQILLMSLLKKSNGVNIENTDNFIDKLNDIKDFKNKIIIAINLDVTYEIFYEDENFKSPLKKYEERKDWQKLTGWCGNYKDSDVFEIHNRYYFYWKYILVLNLEYLPKIIFKKLKNREGESNLSNNESNYLTNNIYLEVIDLNKDEKRRKELLGTKIRGLNKEFEDEGEYEVYLKRQTEILQAEYFELEYPNNFSGNYYRFK